MYIVEKKKNLLEDLDNKVGNLNFYLKDGTRSVV